MKTPMQELINSVGCMAQGLDADELYDYFMKKATQMLEKEKDVMCQFAWDYNDEYINNGEVPPIQERYNQTFNTKDQ